MEEIWKDAEGYEGFYQVSNYGRIKRVEHKDSYGHVYKERLLTINPRDKRGYCRVHLSKNGVTKWHSVHTLVAAAFCEKKDGYDIVNHIDNNPSNNAATNLEWTTYKGNMQHAAKQGRMKPNYENLAKAQESRKVPVIAIIENGNRLYFESQRQAALKLGISSKHIAACCRGEYGYNKTGGYKFIYADPERQRRAKPKRVKMTDEERKRFFSERMKGNDLMLGKELKEETIEKLKNTSLCKAVMQFDKEGNCIKEYRSAIEAKRQTSINHISACCRGERKTAGGYIWRYK